MEFKSFYNSIKDRKANTWCIYTTRLDTYGCGCTHNCSYCYSRHLLEFRKNWNDKDPKISNIEKIRKKVYRLSPGEVVKLGGMTDCFQPIEKIEKVTYQTIKYLNEKRINYLIVTKSAIVADEEYLDIYDINLAHFQITITATDDETALKYEKASLISERIKAIEILYLLGFDVSVRLSPFIFSNIDFNVINGIYCDKILIEFLKVNHFIKKTFDIDYSRYTVKYGNQWHLELSEKIKQIEHIKNFTKKTVGESVLEHYLYFSENYNYNRADCCNLDIINDEYYESRFLQ